ncbi:MAG: AraC family transcriptional regulator [Muribaculaceae bacterium]|nr:AraC family transcriptional regulator [Muribaculaceae bacterium]
MEQDIKTYEISLLERVAAEFCCIDDSVVLAHLSSEINNSLSELSNKAFKVDGSLFLILAKGDLNISINFEEYDVHGPSTISFPPGTVVQLNTEKLEVIDAYLLGYSAQFLQEVNISFAAISRDAMLSRKSPIFELQEREMSQLVRYLRLIQSVINDKFNNQLSRHVVSNLTSALFYQMMIFLYKRIEITDGNSIGPKRSSYVHDFIKLVHLYYTKERSVNFYASKLYISPKYLSFLVKEATGRSAAQWIDHFVIMEAKNLLRFSGKNIQQVAYTLNFANQSSFGKYFKHITGMSPTEFQKS